jgi:RHS repeat-associated protein
MQGNADLYRYSISAQSSEVITSVSAQGKMMYSDSLIYIMDNNNIEALAYTDTSSVANLQRSSITPPNTYRYSGFSASTTINILNAALYDPTTATNFNRVTDYKLYELKDLPIAFGIGNVRVVISDIKEPTDANFNQFTADLQSYYNYYPFGMLQPKRHYTLAEEYKFGFNGMEMDNEVEGNTGSIYTTHFRQLGVRLGRWWSMDPEKFPWESSYTSMGNNPILFTDVLGNSIDPTNLYDKDDDGNYKYPQQIKAFELYASTTEGETYIREHAHAGYELQGVFIKDLYIKVETEGNMSKKGFDVEFGVADLGPNEGETQHKLTNDNTRLLLTFVLSNSTTLYGETPRELLLKTRNLIHEIYYHGDYYENIFFKFTHGEISLNKNGNLWTEENYNHWMPLKVTKLGDVGLSILKQVQSTLNSRSYDDPLFYSSKNTLWYFNQSNTMIRHYNFIKRDLSSPFSKKELYELLKYGLPWEE